MKKLLFIGSIAAILVFIWFGQNLWTENNQSIKAQTSDEETLKKLEHDKTIPQEKVDLAFAEAKKIEDDILSLIKKKKPGFKLHNTNARHLMYGNNPGERGRTINELSWRTSKSELIIEFELAIKKESTQEKFLKGMESISSGDFFEIKDVGDKAILVKNVYGNNKMTNVGFHFIKGRAIVAMYITNHQQKTEKNEKELMEIVRLIEPLIVARDNFDD